MAQFERLLAEHAALRTAAQRLLSVTETEAGYRAVAPGLLREIVDLLVDHEASESSIDYAPHDEHAGAALPLSERLFALQMEWGDFVDAWPTMNVARDWPGFSVAARVILPKLIEVIDAEDKLLARMPHQQSGAATAR
ncbi:hypothetical protein [Sphingomonas jatrophae]|uniref:hypothetical protein n=1 Tax=Sphingomonas jatrophae TaxID=1166337 RepID=UPI000B88648A|nr:hypothetical protein [Sphingomonas jatrophae]